MENILYYKKQIVITLSIFIVFLLSSIFIYYNNEKQVKERKINKVESITKKDGNNENNSIVEDDIKDNDNENTNSKYVYIDVKGYVSNPGVYKLKKGSIVNDVLIAAGGIKENADTICVNLSKKVLETRFNELLNLYNDIGMLKDTTIFLPNRYEFQNLLDSNMEVLNMHSFLDEFKTKLNGTPDKTSTSFTITLNLAISKV